MVTPLNYKKEPMMRSAYTFTILSLKQAYAHTRDFGVSIISHDHTHSKKASLPG